MPDDLSDLLYSVFGARTRQVFETQRFTEQLAKIGRIDRVDEAIAAVQLILTQNAEVFPVVRGLRRVRLAKTEAVADVPALNIWYQIDDDTDSGSAAVR